MKSNQLLGKSILVAGASGFLGIQVIEGILKSGGQVVAVDIKTGPLEERLLSIGIGTDSSLVTIFKLNLNLENNVKNFFESNVKIDGAVNCSYPRNAKYGADLFDVTLDSFNENVSLHLGSSFLFIQQCAAYFEKHKSPFSVVNISSIYGVVAPRFAVYNETHMTMPVEYAAIKSALLHLDKYFSSYVNDSNFRVNSVSPGGLQNGQDERFLKKYADFCRGKGMLDTQDIIGAIIFLLSEQSQYITAQNIVVDDGFSL